MDPRSILVVYTGSLSANYQDILSQCERLFPTYTTNKTHTKHCFQGILYSCSKTPQMPARTIVTGTPRWRSPDSSLGACAYSDRGQRGAENQSRRLDGIADGWRHQLHSVCG